MAVTMVTVLISGPLGSGNAMIIANAIWLPVFTILASICVGAVHSSEQVLDQLQSRVRDDEVAANAADLERTRLQQELAELLHSMQSRLYTSRISGKEQLELPELVPSLDLLRTPEELIDSVLTPWSSVMDITLSLPLTPLSPQQARNVKRVI